jgi:hypothetical protein
MVKRAQKNPKELKRAEKDSPGPSRQAVELLRISENFSG